MTARAYLHHTCGDRYRSQHQLLSCANATNQPRRQGLTRGEPSGCSSRPSAGPPRRSAPRRGRPLDLADHRRAHPTPARPPPGRRPTPTLGKTRPPGPAHPSQGPPRLSEHPPDDPAPRPRTQTQPTRPRTPARLPQPTPRTRHDVGKTVKRDRTITARQAAHRLKIKLRASYRTLISLLAVTGLFSGARPCGGALFPAFAQLRG